MHFTNDAYDCFRFHFKAKNLTPSHFSNRNDRYFFDKYATQFRSEKQYRQFIFANIFFANRQWIGDFEGDCFSEYLGRLQSISYRFSGDLKTLKGVSGSLDTLLRSDTSDEKHYPPIMTQMVYHNLMFETVVIMDSLTNFIDHAQVKDTILWPTLAQDIQNAKPFIATDIDMEKMRKIVLSLFTS
jgi:hypothetical protein